MSLPTDAELAAIRSGLPFDPPKVHLERIDIAGALDLLARLLQHDPALTLDEAAEQVAGIVDAAFEFGPVFEAVDGPIVKAVIKFAAGLVGGADGLRSREL